MPALFNELSSGDKFSTDWDKEWSNFKKKGKKTFFSQFSPNKYVTWNPRRSNYPLSEEVDPIKRTERSNLRLWTSPEFTLVTILAGARVQLLRRATTALILANDEKNITGEAGDEEVRSWPDVRVFENGGNRRKQEWEFGRKSREKENVIFTLQWKSIDMYKDTRASSLKTQYSQTSKDMRPD
ncbi:unnamed protein product [Dovyalis caffra]|uniref:Uncharacterized protein n=1 Tax=Dovyalis caffra TaxID=77055 RepID=A0AAV1S322_9ROSI|nr:unnamed protein product [Dovyalis caffra]